MSLISATRAGIESVRGVARASGRAGVSMAAAITDPSITVTVGAGRDQSAEIYGRFFTQTFDTVGHGRVTDQAARNFLAAFTNLNQNTGYNVPDRMISDVYALIFASHRGFKLPGYSNGGR